MLIAAGVGRLAVRLGEYPAALVPLGAGVLPLSVLKLAVCDDQLEELVGKGDAAAASAGLDLHFDQAAMAALRAPASVAGAIRRTRRGTCPLVPFAVLGAWFRLVVAGATRVRAGATVLPGLPLQSLHDLQGLAGLVQSRPFQPECLALAEPQCQRDDEPHSVALVQCQGQDAVDLVGLKGIDFSVFDAWRFGQSHGIASDMTTFEGLAERGARGAVHLMRRTGLEASGLHPGIQLFEVLGLDAVDPVGAEAGYQVLVHRSAVAEIGLVAYRWPGDVLKPVDEPPLHGPRPARLNDNTIVTLPFEPTDFR